MPSVSKALCQTPELPHWKKIKKLAHLRVSIPKELVYPGFTAKQLWVIPPSFLHH